jgi:hypothetical protein
MEAGALRFLGVPDWAFWLKTTLFVDNSVALVAIF